VTTATELDGLGFLFIYGINAKLAAGRMIAFGSFEDLFCFVYPLGLLLDPAVGRTFLMRDSWFLRSYVYSHFFIFG
jgi:hypothetical protein